MEVALLKDASLRFKTKTTTLLTDPVGKGDAEVILLTDYSRKISSVETGESTKVVIQGAGEYEVGGVSITGMDIKGELVYSILADGIRILLISDKGMKHIKEEDEYTGVIIRVSEAITDTDFASFSSEIFLYYGDLEKMKITTENSKKIQKVNLKKKEELIGSVILLTQ